jgi:tight adherence protein C
MPGMLADLLPQADPVEVGVFAAIFASVLLIVFGIAAVFAPAGVAERRLAAIASRPTGPALALRRHRGTATPAMLERLVTPHNVEERSKVGRMMIAAGYRGPHAVRTFYIVRTVIGLLLPIPLILMGIFSSLGIGAPVIQLPLLGGGISGMLCAVMLVVAAGFYGPLIVVRRRIAARQQEIRRGFPNALDLMQVAVQAGLGFDAALAKIAEELVLAHPILAEEFATVGVELRAGKPREQVLNDLAQRSGVEEVGSFVMTIKQSMRFGTSIADALETFSDEMRHKRMMLAEEKANKLPVKLSAALAFFMLPAVLTVCLGPIIIHAIRMMFPNNG